MDRKYRDYGKSVSGQCPFKVCSLLLRKYNTFSVHGLYLTQSSYLPRFSNGVNNINPYKRAVIENKNDIKLHVFNVIFFFLVQRFFTFHLEVLGSSILYCFLLYQKQPFSKGEGEGPKQHLQIHIPAGSQRERYPVYCWNVSYPSAVQGSREAKTIHVQV